MPFTAPNLVPSYIKKGTTSASSSSKTTKKSSSKKVSAIKLPSANDYMGQANEIVGGQIGQQVAANNSGKQSAKDAYAAMLAQLRDQFAQGKSALNSQAEVDRSRLNATMADRGMSYGPSAGVNFGRFDSAVQSKLGELAQNFQTQGATAAQTQASRIQALDEATRALQAGAPGQAMTIASALANQEIERQKAAAQITASQATAAGAAVNENGLTAAQQFAFDHRFDVNPNESNLQGFSQAQAAYAAADKYKAAGLDPATIKSRIMQEYGFDIGNYIPTPAVANGNVWGMNIPQQAFGALPGLNAAFPFMGAPGAIAQGALQGTTPARNGLIDLYNNMRSGLGNIFNLYR